MNDSYPAVYIAESLTPEDEATKRPEGEALSQILHLHGKTPKYKYFRTESEFVEIVQDFIRSQYRYFHLSCHGTPHRIEFSCAPISFNKLAEMFDSSLNNRRLFLSSCSASNQILANALHQKSPELFSLIGPAEDIAFTDALAFWTTFYHLSFKDPRYHDSMKAKQVKRNVTSASKIFKTPISYFTNVGDRLAPA